MTTPTSPDRQPNSGPGDLAPAIDAIAGGDFSRSRLAAFSDLSRQQSAWLRQHWLDIPSTERHALLLALSEVSDESLEYNFNRVFRVALEDPDPVLRQLAISDLWEDEGGDLATVYVNLLRNDPSDDVRATAAAALSVFCDAIADGELQSIDAETLIELFSSLIENPAESPTVRRRCLGAVAAFSADPRIDDLIRLGLKDEDQTVVAGAVFAMGRTASDHWLPDLIEFMRSDDAELRFEAARASGLLGDMDAVQALRELIYDSDTEVRAAVLEALGSIGGPAAIRILREVEQDEDFDEPEEVEGAIDSALLTVNPIERQY